MSASSCTARPAGSASRRVRSAPWARAPAEVNLLALMGARGRIHGSTLRPRPVEQKAHAARLVERHVLPLVDSGRIQVPVEATFAMQEATLAYDRFEAGAKLGKIVLVNPEDPVSSG